MQRGNILRKTKKLKDTPDSEVGEVNVKGSKVYLKRDQHPSIRREWKRLYDVLKAELQKPENVGHHLVLDYKNKQVKRDNLVIDSWDFLM